MTLIQKKKEIYEKKKEFFEENKTEKENKNKVYIATSSQDSSIRLWKFEKKKKIKKKVLNLDFEIDFELDAKIKIILFQKF